MSPSAYSNPQNRSIASVNYSRKLDTTARWVYGLPKLYQSHTAHLPYANTRMIQSFEALSKQGAGLAWSTSFPSVVIILTSEEGNEKISCANLNPTSDVPEGSKGLSKEGWTEVDADEIDGDGDGDGQVEEGFVNVHLNPAEIAENVLEGTLSQTEVDLWYRSAQEALSRLPEDAPSLQDLREAAKTAAKSNVGQ
jgi:hypothetical protein